MTEYVDSSGCTQAVFTDESIKSSSPVPMCPIHGLDHKPHCRECDLHQFLQVKYIHDAQIAQAIEQSLDKKGHQASGHQQLELMLDNSSIIYIDGLPWCSKHLDSMQQCCHTCNQVFLLRD